MTKREAIDLLQNEIKCIKRSDICNRRCAECELVKSTDELLEAYSLAIVALETQPLHINDFIDVPNDLNEKVLISTYGVEAVRFYEQRLMERQRAGRSYLKPLKTIYIWAAQDKRTNQGYYSTYRGYQKHTKNKNHGRS